MNLSKSYLEDPEFRAGKHEYCEGRICFQCGKCRDWYYTGDRDNWRWIQNVANWTNDDWKRWHNDDYWKSFTKRQDGATCTGDGDLRGFLDSHFLLFGCLCDR